MKRQCCNLFDSDGKMTGICFLSVTKFEKERCNNSIDNKFFIFIFHNKIVSFCEFCAKLRNIVLGEECKEISETEAKLLLMLDDKTIDKLWIF